jgi:hypothetical protein
MIRWEQKTKRIQKTPLRIEISARGMLVAAFAFTFPVTEHDAQVGYNASRERDFFGLARHAHSASKHYKFRAKTLCVAGGQITFWSIFQVCRSHHAQQCHSCG